MVDKNKMDMLFAEAKKTAKIMPRNCYEYRSLCPWLNTPSTFCTIRFALAMSQRKSFICEVFHKNAQGK